MTPMLLTAAVRARSKSFFLRAQNRARLPWMAPTRPNSHAVVWRLRDGRFQCADCSQRTSVTAGTIIDRTRTPLPCGLPRVRARLRCGWMTERGGGQLSLRDYFPGLHPGVKHSNLGFFMALKRSFPHVFDILLVKSDWFPPIGERNGPV